MKYLFNEYFSANGGGINRRTYIARQVFYIIFANILLFVKEIYFIEAIRNQSWLWVGLYVVIAWMVLWGIVVNCRRRLLDAGKSNLSVFLVIIPLVNFFYWIYLAIIPSKRHSAIVSPHKDAIQETTSVSDCEGVQPQIIQPENFDQNRNCGLKKTTVIVNTLAVLAVVCSGWVYYWSNDQHSQLVNQTLFAVNNLKKLETKVQPDALHEISLITPTLSLQEQAGIRKAVGKTLDKYRMGLLPRPLRSEGEYYLWGVYNTILSYNQGKLTSNQWKAFIETGEIPDNTPGHYTEPPERINERNLQKHNLTQQLKIMDERISRMEMVRIAASGAAVVLLGILLLTNRKFLLYIFSAKKTALLANSSMIVFAAYIFAEFDSMATSAVMIFCAVGNAVLIIQNKQNGELSSWSIYTINLFLAAVGSWIMTDNSQILPRIGTVFLLVAFINFLHQYYSAKRSATIRTDQ